MDVDEISLEQFRPTVLDSLKWNQHDNTMAVLSDNGIYLLSLRPDGSQSRFVLNISGPKIVRICWSSCPFPLGQVHRMVLFVLNREGKLQAWAETASALISRWELCSELDLESVPLSVDSFEDNVYVGDSSGNVHFVKFKDGKLKLAQTKLLAENEPVTKLSASRTKLAFAHGPHKVSCYDFVKTKSVCLIEDPCIGTTYLNWSNDDIYAIKYNQLFKVDANGKVFQKEIGSAEVEPEGFCIACLSPDGTFIWLAGFEGNIFKYEIVTSTLVTLYQQDKSSPSRTLGFCASSSGRTLAWLSVDQEPLAKIVLADSGFVGGILSDDDAGVWEASRYNIDSCSGLTRLKCDLFSPDTAKKDAAIRNLSLLAAKELTTDEAYSSSWNAYQQFLENPANKWAALKNFSPETCPDCGDAQVLFESFTEAKCQSGHVLDRCSGSFACLGTDDPFQACEDCTKKLKVGLFESCPYCSGRLFHVT